MKKLLLTVLCTTALTLTACDKTPNEAPTHVSNTTAPAVALSTDNLADIKTDFAALQTMSTDKAKEALSFQTEIMQAAQTGDKAALTGMVDKLKTYVEGFNKDLDNLALKSSEVASLRDKMKESNQLGLEMSEAGLSDKPDAEKIMELQKKATEVQHSIITETQALQSKVNTPAP